MDFDHTSRVHPLGFLQKLFFYHLSRGPRDITANNLPEARDEVGNDTGVVWPLFLARPACENVDSVSKSRKTLNSALRCTS